MTTFSITSRIDAVTRIPERYLAAELPAPRAVKIELTSQCNYRCGFCAHRLRMKDRGEMDPAFFERVVGEMVDAGVEELGMFYIGESFMCDWLPEAIAHAKERGIRYDVPHHQRLARHRRARGSVHEGGPGLAQVLDEQRRRGAVRRDRGGEAASSSATRWTT